MSFPKDFVWGCASASYQVEGAHDIDGRGWSVWDMFCRKEHAVWSGHTGDTACDHYHRYKEDVGLMQELGLKAYRLSVAWPRVLPEGVGKANPRGLAFYDKLVDELLAAGITPYITLFHWDFPYALYLRGGWLNRESADWFADYAALVVKRLGDRVKHWITHNEPQCFVGHGHQSGVHAPGDKFGTREWLTVGHHVLLAHGKAVQAIRAASKGRCQVGFAPINGASIPASNSPRDVAVARKATFSVGGKSAWIAAWWMDPVYLGHYPEDGLKLYADELPPIHSGDMKTIQQPLDFFGLNLYAAETLRAGKDGQRETVAPPVGHALTAFGWPVTPSAIYWAARFYYERYKLPIYFTENGMANCDWVALDGKVHDPQRIDFLQRYLREVGRAIADGADVRGYFAWSIMDNFEWAEGYKMRFGLIYVDYPTQRRIPKDSYFWYRNVIRTNGASL